MKSNVVLIVSDEHQYDLIGCGRRNVISPHISGLVAAGTRFANAYTPSPICVPARASIATGQYVHTHRCWDNAIAYAGEPQSWAARLRDKGIRSESVGKLHYQSESAPVGFSRQHLPMHIEGGVGQVWGAVRNPLPINFGISPLFNKLGAGISDYNRYDMAVADHAVDWLSENASARFPWVLSIGFVAPHFPLVVPQKYLDLYPLDKVDLPALSSVGGFVRHPWVERQAQFLDNDLVLATDERRRLAIACYLALITFMDEQVGKILRALEDQNLNETTTVIYCSDHGDNLGERGMWNKGLLYRESTGVPLVMKGPGIPDARICRTPVSLIDLHNTILECADASVMNSYPPGESLVKVANKADDFSRIVLSEYHAVGSPSAAYMLADARFKYHHYVGYAPELFDLSVDPFETTNVATQAAFAGVASDYESRLRAILDPDEVDRMAKADQDKLVESFGGRDTALKLGPKSATAAPKT